MSDENKAIRINFSGHLENDARVTLLGYGEIAVTIRFPGAITEAEYRLPEGTLSGYDLYSSKLDELEPLMVQLKDAHGAEAYKKASSYLRGAIYSAARKARDSAGKELKEDLEEVMHHLETLIRNAVIQYGHARIEVEKEVVTKQTAIARKVLERAVREGIGGYSWRR